MKIIEISSEEYPNSVATRAHSCVVRGQTRPNGDVEIVRSVGGEDIPLTVIPKEKRAELAQFLVSAE